MSITPAYLDELRDRLSIAEVIGRRLQWDQRKSNPARGDYWACCPFHGEKTPSFHVEDRKGFFYCFGCHEKGDAIGFVMKMDGAPFHEAVEALAAEAGMAPPARDPQARERAEKRGGLQDLTEAAQRFYRAQLSGAAAREARAYLEGRGLRPETLEAFGLGYAPRGPAALTEHLRSAGAEPARIVEAGLAGEREDGTLYDRFRERIVFPIRDARDRVIAFGGRALRADAQAKYLNSPETPLFHKGRTLYNIGPARAAAGRGAPLIVAEGYMDVIALAQAGFEAAVAPLGTALTEDQLRLLWRICDEPALALDGDAAGQRAAERAAGLALPLLAPGKTLRFLTLPAGSDPDDLIRESGRGAFAALLERAEPLAEALWRMEAAARPLDTPERRAGFDAAIRALLDRISDPAVRGHYAEMFREKRAQLFAPAPRPKPGWKPARGGRGPAGPLPPLPPSSEARRSALAANHRIDPAAALEEAILREALKAPESPEIWAESLADLDFSDPALDSIRAALISALFGLIEDGAPVTLSALCEATRRRTEDRIRSRLEALEPDAHAAASLDTLTAALARRRMLATLDQERQDAESDFERDGSERAYRRMLHARNAHENALKQGFHADFEDRKVSVQSYIDQEIWKRKPKPRSGR